MACVITGRKRGGEKAFERRWQDGRRASGNRLQRPFGERNMWAVAGLLRACLITFLLPLWQLGEDLAVAGRLQVRRRRSKA